MKKPINKNLAKVHPQTLYKTITVEWFLEVLNKHASLKRNYMVQTMRLILHKTSRKVIMKSLYLEKRYFKKRKTESMNKYLNKKYMIDYEQKA